MTTHHDLGNSPNEHAPKPSLRSRRERSVKFEVAGRSFSFAMDINLVLMGGVISRRPAVAVVKNDGTRHVWSRMRHVDQSVRRRGIYLPLRFQGKLAEWAYANLSIGDQVVVSGRLWLGEATKRGMTIFYNWLQVETATCGLPVQVDSDPNYVRVRADVYSRMCAQLGEDVVDLKVPPLMRKTLKWGDIDPYETEEPVSPEEDPELPT